MVVDINYIEIRVVILASPNIMADWVGAIANRRVPFSIFEWFAIFIENAVITIGVSNLIATSTNCDATIGGFAVANAITTSVDEIILFLFLNHNHQECSQKLFL